MRLGEALYREITRDRSPYTEVQSVGDAILWFLGAAGGNVSAAARLAGVARSTFRSWLAGSQPRNGGELYGAAIRGQRRQRLGRGREAKLRDRDVIDMTMDATYGYDGKRRDMPIGSYLDDGLWGDLVDAYLDGASLEELEDEFAGAISGAPFYEQTFRDGEWDIHSIEGYDD